MNSDELKERCREVVASLSGEIALPGLSAAVEVIRDRWGVPHIYADNQHDLFFAQGYAHAQDRFWQMEFWRRLGAGRLSELVGPATLPHDRLMRTLGLYRAAQASIAQLSPEVRALGEAYAAGVNAYISAPGRAWPLEFHLLDAPCG